MVAATATAAEPAPQAEAGAARILKDDEARRIAIMEHRRSLLVEAGAGSGKTALMAGRIALMLADGVAPCRIAAVTFTELAASELLSRVREFVSELQAGNVPAELRVALPEGVSDARRAHLAQAAGTIDEITCSTIHGFCQKLIKPYPAEADIDPGAAIIDRSQSDMVFAELVDAWLRERLSEERGGLLPEMVLRNDKSTVELVHCIAKQVRARRDLIAPPATAIAPLLAAFHSAVAQMTAFREDAGITEQDTDELIGCLRELSEEAGKVDADTPSGLVALLLLRPAATLVTQQGTFRKYKKKTKWVAVATQAGLPKTEGERLCGIAGARYQACDEAWQALPRAACSHALTVLIEEARQILARYMEHKRNGAQLDFDDLIYAARNLLRDHEEVRRALAERFPYVLVDEFQDTDPLQIEIFWRLCGDPPAPGCAWKDFRIRPGALFLVGDPKQAIYRFRGADAMAYVTARTLIQTHDPNCVLSISTNFRSCVSILTFVNGRFQLPLSSPPQPGFTALDAFHDDPPGGPCVMALEVKCADESGEASAEQRRDAEADAVAELCARMIGNRTVIDRRSGYLRACQPGDIALLAPTGVDLWRYEEALERRAIPVATQAGKGLFRRQEIQDLIAITRVLCDRRDTLALGALLRGPLVGLSDEELLDIVWRLPRSADDPERIAQLDLLTDPADIGHPVAAAVLANLQHLYKRAQSTTPYMLLSQAVDVLRV